MNIKTGISDFLKEMRRAKSVNLMMVAVWAILIIFVRDSIGAMIGFAVVIIISAIFAVDLAFLRGKTAGLEEASKHVENGIKKIINGIVAEQQKQTEAEKLRDSFMTIGGTNGKRTQPTGR